MNFDSRNIPNARRWAYHCAVIILLLIFCGCSVPNSSDKQETKDMVKADSTRPVKHNYFADCKQLKLEAGRLDSILLLETELDKSLGMKAIKAFTDFAYYCQTDSMSPVYLIKTAQVAMAIKNIPQAKLALDRCIEGYPFFNNRAAALFLLAQLYDENTYLNNENEARKLYQKIIEEYPNNEWAASARGAIKFIGMSDEQVLNKIKKEQ